MAAGSTAGTVRARFLECCKQWDASGSDTVPTSGLSVVLTRLGLAPEDAEAILVEFDDGNGFTNYVRLAVELWDTSPKEDGRLCDRERACEGNGSAPCLNPPGAFPTVPPVLQQALAAAPSLQPQEEIRASRTSVVAAIPAYTAVVPAAPAVNAFGLGTSSGMIVPSEMMKQTLQDGSVYEGQLQNGERHGFGRIFFGHVYEGEWENNQMHGKGKFMAPDGSVYEGQWTQNNVGPHGSISWAGGPRYEGYFVNGLQHGEGKITWIDGRSYEGQFANGRQHGRGAFTTSSGDRCDSEWKDGQFVQWLNKGPSALPY